MTVSHLEILVEEPSAEAGLRLLLPSILGNVTFDVYAFTCKDDMRSKLGQRLRGYRHRIQPDWCIVVLIDNDDDNCRELKAALDGIASHSGLVTRTESRISGRNYQVINRIVVEELEAWFFGDWQAVREAYPRVPPTIPKKAAYSNPDVIRGGTWEALERILKRAGYFKNGLRKIELAKEVCSRMKPERNSSKSFRVFLESITELAV